MNRIFAYFSQYTKTDWEILGYFVLIIGMVILIPVVLFFDYFQSYAWQLQVVEWKIFLTKSLLKWWQNAIDSSWLMW